MVAGYAGAHYVVPGMWAVPPSRDDVIECELARTLAAVLTGEPVAIEHCLSGEATAHYGPLHHVYEADH